MATVSIRTAARDWIAAQLPAHANLAANLAANPPRATAVPVDKGFPRNLEREHVWCAGIRGTVNYPHMKAGRKTRDDEFVISWLFQSATPGDNPAECTDRVEEMADALHDVLANDPTMGSLDGVLHAIYGPTDDGPDVDATDEGYVAFKRVDVTVKSRLT